MMASVVTIKICNSGVFAKMLHQQQKSLTRSRVALRFRKSQRNDPHDQWLAVALGVGGRDVGDVMGVGSQTSDGERRSQTGHVGPKCIVFGGEHFQQEILRQSSAESFVACDLQRLG